MQPEIPAPGFIIWGVDQIPYGPVELPVLVAWIQDERVLADTWIFAQRAAIWKRAADIPELQMFFRRKSSPSDGSPSDLRAGVLRRVKILADLTDAQLERFSSSMEQEQIPQWTQVVKQGDPGDTMFLILEGELRVRLATGGKETILATLGPGDFFGDLSLFDHGPRSADVIANVDSTVLKISSAGFEKLAKDSPEVASPFLLSTIKTLAARIRADNKRLRDSVNFSSFGGL
ncbi:MAG: cyclic nucleotide-binding domain-containing protein [Pedosphaera sp.]|nr:cyclic nucleotide-binding domain-containing protein [Pedosphaera sp.]